MDLEVTSIMTTVCFWYWTIQKIAVSISPLREEYRWQKRLAHCGYAVLFGLQVGSLFIQSTLFQWLISIPSAYVVLYILVISNFDREGFWSKQRNQVVGGLTLFILALGLPLLVTSTALIPNIFSIVLTHGFHKAQNKQYADAILDLDSLRAKVTKLQSDLHTHKVQSNAKNPDSKVTYIYPETRHQNNSANTSPN